MSIALPSDLPAFDVLRQERLEVIAPGIAAPAAKRPLKIALLNLMPEKIKTEIQLARLLGASEHHVELSLLVPESYRPKTTPAAHMAAHYRPWSAVRDEHFDGLIVTGAPVETLAFEAVDYWAELRSIFDWARSNVTRSFYICWAAQAALNHFHGVAKHPLERKSFGIFKHRVVSRSAALLAGLGECFWIPVSRHTEMRAEELRLVPGLETLVHGPETGPCLIEDRARRAHYMFNHLEYDADTLKQEYLRDQAAGRPIQMPENYFPDDDLDRAPVNFWRKAALRLFGNWLDQIERERCRAACDELVMDWLAQDSGITDLPVRSELLVVVSGGAQCVPRVLSRVAGRRRWSRDLAWRAVGEGTLMIELNVDARDEGSVQQTVHRLFGLAQIRSVAVRNPRGFGGLYRAGDCPGPMVGLSQAA